MSYSKGCVIDKDEKIIVFLCLILYNYLEVNLNYFTKK